MKRLFLCMVILLTASVAEARGPRVFVYPQPFYGYSPYGYVQPYGWNYYGAPYRVRGNAFYTQQFLGPPLPYARGFYGPRGGVVVGGFGVF